MKGRESVPKLWLSLYRSETNNHGFFRPWKTAVVCSGPATQPICCGSCCSCCVLNSRPFKPSCLNPGGFQMKDSIEGNQSFARNQSIVADQRFAPANLGKCMSEMIFCHGWIPGICYTGYVLLPWNDDIDRSFGYSHGLLWCKERHFTTPTYVVHLLVEPDRFQNSTS